MNDSTTKAIQDLWTLWDESDARRDKPPDGSRTVKQYQAVSGLGEKTAMRRLREGVADGALKTQMFVVDGHTVRHFWPVEAPQCPESKPLTSGPNGKKRRISG